MLRTLQACSKDLIRQKALMLAGSLILLVLMRSRGQMPAFSCGQGHMFTNGTTVARATDSARRHSKPLTAVVVPSQSRLCVGRGSLCRGCVLEDSEINLVFSR